MRDHWSDVTAQIHAEARIEEGDGVWPSMVNLDLGDWNDREWITWREQWNKQGWPDGRSSDDR